MKVNVRKKKQHRSSSWCEGEARIHTHESFPGHRRLIAARNYERLLLASENATYDEAGVPVNTSRQVRPELSAANATKKTTNPAQMLLRLMLSPLDRVAPEIEHESKSMTYGGHLSCLPRRWINLTSPPQEATAPASILQVAPLEIVMEGVECTNSRKVTYWCHGRRQDKKFMLCRWHKNGTIIHSPLRKEMQVVYVVTTS